MLLKQFPVAVSQGSIISSIGNGINAVISAIASVIETIISAIVAVRRTVFVYQVSLNLMRTCYYRYSWRFSMSFSTFYAAAALVDAVGAREAGHIIVGEGFSAAAAAAAAHCKSGSGWWGSRNNMHRGCISGASYAMKNDE